jgi:NAD dependent epimerase/dehydratase family enzyme
MSWISADDLIRVIGRCIADESLNGPVNAVAPEPVRNAEFGRLLGAVLGRPAVVPAPAFALRLAFGEMADEVLLASCRVRPGVLERAGHSFEHRELEAALRHLLGTFAPE